MSDDTKKPDLVAIQVGMTGITYWVPPDRVEHYTTLLLNGGEK